MMRMIYPFIPRQTKGRSYYEHLFANDMVWDNVEYISELPDIIVERMKHYFSTYKIAPGKEAEVWIEELYGRERALEVVKASMEDYDDLLMTIQHS